MTGMNANVFRENPLVTAVQCPTSFPYKCPALSTAIPVNLTANRFGEIGFRIAFTCCEGEGRRGINEARATTYLLDDRVSPG